MWVILFVAVIIFLLGLLATVFNQKEMIREKLTAAQIANAKLEASINEQNKSFKERIEIINESKEKLEEMFKGISAQALQKMEEKSYVEEERRGRALSDLIKPMKESLLKLDDKMNALEKDRKGDKETLTEQLRRVAESEKDLLKETKGLKDALSKPEIRGMWGEMQLKRTIEVSGMLNHCDFLEQSVEETESGRIRPDMIIKLAGNRTIIVDSKAPIEGFLKALSVDNETEKKVELERHARHLKTHIQMLSKKKYYEGFAETPEFVVLFIPSEVFLSSALQMDPTLIEVGAKLNVILATPTTLIGLLRSISYGWKTENLTQNARAVQSLGCELYKRLLDMSKHLSAMGKSLSSAVDGYNKTIGTYERRVLSSARKFEELGAASTELIPTTFELIDAELRTPGIQHTIEVNEITIDD